MTMIIVDNLNLGSIDEYIKSIMPGYLIEVVTTMTPTFKLKPSMPSQMPSQYIVDTVDYSLVTYIYSDDDAVVAAITEQHDWLLFQLKLKFNVDKLEIFRNDTWDGDLRHVE